jgi:hypothetical protein
MRKKRGTGIDSAWRGSNGDGGLPCKMAGKGLYHEFKKTRRMARRNHEREDSNDGAKGETAIDHRLLSKRFRGWLGSCL